MNSLAYMFINAGDTVNSFHSLVTGNSRFALCKTVFRLVETERGSFVSALRSVALSLPSLFGRSLYDLSAPTRSRFGRWRLFDASFRPVARLCICASVRQGGYLIRSRFFMPVALVPSRAYRGEGGSGAWRGHGESRLFQSRTASGLSLDLQWSEETGVKLNLH